MKLYRVIVFMVHLQGPTFTNSISEKIHFSKLIPKNYTRVQQQKALVFLEFAMNPYDPIARATDKFWNKVFQPIFKRFESNSSLPFTAASISSTQSPVGSSVTSENPQNPKPMQVLITMAPIVTDHSSTMTPKPLQLTSVQVRFLNIC
jgi:hypothetical protein